MLLIVICVKLIKDEIQYNSKNEKDNHMKTIVQPTLLTDMF